MKRPQKASDVKQFIEDYLHQKEVAGGKGMDEEGLNDDTPQKDEDVAMDENDEEEEKKPEPYHVTKVSQVSMF